MKILAQLFLCVVLLVALSQQASAQEWIDHQLTDYPGCDQVNECGSVADTMGHIHHYMVCYMGYPNPVPNDEPVYYMRTDFYGHILTDTVRLNGFNSGRVHVQDLSVMGDGSHSWCTFQTLIPGHGNELGLYLTERDSDGREVLPATVMSYPYDTQGGPIGDWAAAALRPQDRTIHWIGVTPPGGCFRYCRFTSQADTLIWARRIGGTAYGCSNPTVIISPFDLRPWAGMIVAGPGGAFDGIRLIRFNEDTSQTVYHPMAGSDLGLYPHGFGMDGHGRAYLATETDTAHSAYMILDSTMQTIRDWCLISRDEDSESGLKVDSAGNSLLLCNFGTRLTWLYRRGDGAWLHPPSTLDPQMFAQNFSIIAMDSERFAFTCMGFPFGTGQTDQLRLYTYGFPPYDAAPKPRSVDAAGVSLAVHPNPFGSSFEVEVPAHQGGGFGAVQCAGARGLVARCACRRREAGNCRTAPGQSSLRNLLFVAAGESARGSGEGDAYEVRSLCSCRQTPIRRCAPPFPMKWRKGI